MIQLLTTFYADGNEYRRQELEFCLRKNLLAGFDFVSIIVENQENLYYTKSIIKESEKVRIFSIGERPTFECFFHEISKLNNNQTISVVSNTDIFFEPETLNQIKSFFSESGERRVCAALSRWDWSPNKPPVLFSRSDSQDVWALRHVPEKNSSLFDGSIRFPMGIPGCDNRLAHELNRAGYEVLNPCNRILTYHYHDTQIRNAIVNGRPTRVIEPPYLLVNPY